MSKPKSINEISVHTDSAVNSVRSYLNRLIASNNPAVNAKADKLSYWLEDYMKYLIAEETFSPSSLKRYKRGEVIKANLGYNIGSEEGGLHYAVVLDRNNSMHSPVLTIAPLTSVKAHTDIDRLKKRICLYRRPSICKIGRKTYCLYSEIRK